MQISSSPARSHQLIRAISQSVHNWCGFHYRPWGMKIRGWQRRKAKRKQEDKDIEQEGWGGRKVSGRLPDLENSTSQVVKFSGIFLINKSMCIRKTSQCTVQLRISPEFWACKKIFKKKELVTRGVTWPPLPQKTDKVYIKIIKIANQMNMWDM